MIRFISLASWSLFLGLTVACAAPKENVASVACAPKDTPAATLTENPFGLAETDAGGVPGMQMLRGYFDVEVSTDGATQQIRCMMNLLPDVANSRLFKVATAGHCLPTLSKTTGYVVKLKLQVFYKNGFIPLSIEGFNIDKILTSEAFLNQYIAPLVPNSAQLGMWLPENGTSNCKRWTETFKLGSASNHKTACFSRQDLRIIDAKITEVDAKWVALYEQALLELNRVKGAALSQLPPEMSRGMQALWRAHNVDDARKRNLRAMSYLANVQYCAAGVVTVNPADNQPDPKALCQLRQIQPASLEQFFKVSTTDQEFIQMRSIMSDTVTPVQDLRDRYLGCNHTFGNGPDEVTPCESWVMATNFFNQWVRDSKTNFEALSPTEKRGLTFADYFRIVAPDKTHPTAPQVTILGFDSHQERNTLASPSYANGFLFDYDPAKNYFSFEKGDSGTALNVFAGFPVAVLSTIDGEPTSGGASILPLPEPQEEKPTTSTVLTGCR